MPRQHESGFERGPHDFPSSASARHAADQERRHRVRVRVPVEDGHRLDLRPGLRIFEEVNAGGRTSASRFLVDETVGGVFVGYGF